MLKLFLTLFITLTALSTYSLDIDEACDELKEQQEALLSKLSTSLTEANMAGQCIGYSAINNNKKINLNAACAEFIEQQENLLGNFSTSMQEANQAGICLGAIYAACGTIDFSDAANQIKDNLLHTNSEADIRRVTDC